MNQSALQTPGCNCKWDIFARERYDWAVLRLGPGGGRPLQLRRGVRGLRPPRHFSTYKTQKYGHVANGSEACATCRTVAKLLSANIDLVPSNMKTVCSPLTFHGLASSATLIANNLKVTSTNCAIQIFSIPTFRADSSGQIKT